MMGKAGGQRPVSSPRRRQTAPPVPRDEAEEEAIGRIDEEFDAVDLGEIMRDVLGIRGPVEDRDAV